MEKALTESLTRARSWRLKAESPPNLNRAGSVNTKRNVSPFASIKSTLQSVSSNLVASVSPTLSQSDSSTPSSAPPHRNAAGKSSDATSSSASKKPPARRRMKKKPKEPEVETEPLTSSTEISFLSYEVKDGDTVTSVAANFDITPAELCSINRLFSRTLFPMQKLKIPRRHPVSSSSSPSHALTKAHLREDTIGRRYSQNSDVGHADKLDDDDEEEEGSVVSGEDEEDADHAGHEEAAGDDEAFIQDNHTEEENDPCARQYIKVEVKYVTETEGTIGGCLLITPNMFMFSPWCSDPVVMEYGLDRFIVEFPIHRIRSIAMYNNPSVMYFDRRNRAKIDCLVSPGSPGQQPALSEPITRTTEESDEPVGATVIRSTLVGTEEGQEATEEPSEPAEDQTTSLSLTPGTSSMKTTTGSASDATSPLPPGSGEGHGDSSPFEFLSLSSLVETGDVNRSKPPSAYQHFHSIPGSTWTMLDQPHNFLQHPDLAHFDALSSGVMLARRHVFDSLPFYLCVNSPSRHRGTKCSTMVRDEYWFMIPQKEAEDLWKFLMKSGVPGSGGADASGGDETSKSGETGVGVGGAAFVSLSPGDTLLARSRHPRLTEAEVRQRYILHKESMTWELVNLGEMNMGLLKAGATPGAISVNDAEPENLPLPEMLRNSVILNEQKIRNLMMNLPPDAEGQEWRMLFSTSQHGCSLKSLYRLCQKADRPCVLLILDQEDHVFGALLSDPIKMSDHFYGRADTYVFRWSPHFQKFRWSGDNRFFIKGDVHTLMIGCSSGHSALWLDDHLYRGRSQRCATFNNPPLADEKEDFLVQEVEVWSFG